jgi:hypothetical protein
MKWKKRESAPRDIQQSNFDDVVFHEQNARAIVRAVKLPSQPVNQVLRIHAENREFE